MSGMRMACLADTSAVIRLIRRDPKTVAVMHGRSFAVSFVTIAELHLGILKAHHRGAALQRLKEILPEEEVIYPSETTPVVYAEIRHDLEQRGAVIPSNDIWIAAVAIENDLPLVARDEHFSRVKNLMFVPC